jgi:hypothetical protein
MGIIRKESVRAVSQEGKKIELSVCLYVCVSVCLSSERQIPDLVKFIVSSNR